MLRSTICCQCLWFQSGASLLRSTICYRYLWVRSNTPMLRSAICCHCLWFRCGVPVLRRTVCLWIRSGAPSAKKYGLLPLLVVSKWCPNAMRRITNDCRCLSLRCGAPVLRRTKLVLFVVSKWCPRAKKYDLLPVFVFSEWCPSAKKYDLLLLFVVSKWCPSAKKCGLLPFLWFRSCTPVLRSTICCFFCGFDMVPPC